MKKSLLVVVLALTPLVQAQTPQQMEYERQQREYRLQMERQQEQQRQQQKQMEENARRQQEEMKRLNTPPASPSYSPTSPTPSYGITPQQQTAPRQQSSNSSSSAAPPPTAWKKVISISNTDIYADPTTIKPRSTGGPTMQMRELRDFKTTHQFKGVPYLSAMSTAEYDCAGKRVRIVVTSFYSDHMGRTPVRISADTLPWEPVDSGANAALFKMVCKRK